MICDNVTPRPVEVMTANDNLCGGDNHAHSKR